MHSNREQSVAIRSLPQGGYVQQYVGRFYRILLLREYHLSNLAKRAAAASDTFIQTSERSEAWQLISNPGTSLAFIAKRSIINANLDLSLIPI